MKVFLISLHFSDFEAEIRANFVRFVRAEITAIQKFVQKWKEIVASKIWILDTT